MASGWIGKATRQALYDRDGRACIYCKTTEAAGALLSLDHLQPRSKRGALKKTRNLITSCHHCNSCRKAMSVEDFQRYLNSNYGISTKGLARKIKNLTSKVITLGNGQKAPR